MLTDEEIKLGLLKGGSEKKPYYMFHLPGTTRLSYFHGHTEQEAISTIKEFIKEVDENGMEDIWKDGMACAMVRFDRNTRNKA